MRLKKILFWLSPWMGLLVMFIFFGVFFLINKNNGELGRLALFTGIVIFFNMAVYLMITYLCLLFYWFAPTLRKIVVYVPIIFFLIGVLYEYRSNSSEFDYIFLLGNLICWLVVYIPVYWFGYKLKLKN